MFYVDTGMITWMWEAFWLQMKGMQLLARGVFLGGSFPSLDLSRRFPSN